MPITINKYVKIYPTYDESGYTIDAGDENGYIHKRDKEIVELQNFSNATDLEVLEWALRRIRCVEGDFGHYGKRLNGETTTIDMLFSFDKDGGLIK